MKCKWIALLLCGVTALLCTGCDTESGYGDFMETTETIEETEEQTLESIPPVPDINRPTEDVEEQPVIADPTETDTAPQVSGFAGSIWLGKMEADDTERFFLFYDETNGSYLQQQDGEGMGFTYAVQGETATFHIGDATAQATAQLIWLDSQNVVLRWDDGSLEDLTWVRSDPSAEFNFYTNDNLCEMAKTYYEALNNTRPEATAISNVDGTISIWLYEKTNGVEIDCDWYTVDRYTAIGFDRTHEAIDLTQPGVVPQSPLPDSTLPSETAASTETTDTTGPTETLPRR